MQIAKKIVPGRGNGKEEGPGKFWRRKVNVAGMPRARGRALGDLTESAWDFGFYFKYENPGRVEIGE